MRIKRIKLENFKRWKSLDLKFGSLNEFYAENGGGKTSIFQAFLWVLGFETENVFPKIDSELIEGLETKVELEWVDSIGFPHTYIRTSKPTFIIDELKIKTKKAYIETICNQVGINQNQLQMICNTYLFNQDTSKWGWINRFAMLNELLHFSSLTLKFADGYEIIGKYIKNYKTPIEIAKILRDNKKTINTRKDTLNGGITTLKEQIEKYNYDYAKLKEEKEKTLIEISNCKQKLNDLTNKDKEKIMLDISLVRDKILHEEKMYELEAEKNKNAISNLKSQLKATNDLILKLQEEIDKLSNDIENCENVAICEVCGSNLPKEQIEILRNSFIQKREGKLKTLDDLLEMVRILEEDIKKIPTSLEKPTTIAPLEEKLSKLQEELKKINEEENEDEIQVILMDIDYYNDVLSDIEQNLFTEKIKLDLEKELESKKKELQELMQDFTNQAKGEEELNSYFKLVEKEYDRVVKQAFGEEISFKFFTLKKDGDYNQDCFVRREIKGMLTSYNEMSLGERLKTDIITSLGFQKLLGVEFPIWVDNAQDMTDDIPSCENQIIILNTSKTINNLKGEYINGK